MVLLDLAPSRLRLARLINSGRVRKVIWLLFARRGPRRPNVFLMVRGACSQTYPTGVAKKPRLKVERSAQIYPALSILL